MKRPSKLHTLLNGFFQCFPYAPTLPSTLKRVEVSVWVKNPQGCVDEEVGVKENLENWCR